MSKQCCARCRTCWRHSRPLCRWAVSPSALSSAQRRPALPRQPSSRCRWCPARQPPACACPLSAVRRTTATRGMAGRRAIPRSSFVPARKVSPGRCYCTARQCVLGRACRRNQRRLFKAMLLMWARPVRLCADRDLPSVSLQHIQRRTSGGRVQVLRQRRHQVLGRNQASPVPRARSNVSLVAVRAARPTAPATRGVWASKASTNSALNASAIRARCLRPAVRRRLRVSGAPG
jgi:hypothetical protein